MHHIISSNYVAAVSNQTDLTFTTDGQWLFLLNGWERFESQLSISSLLFADFWNSIKEADQQ